MTITWTKLALPSNETFADDLYNFLTTFEAVSLKPYPIGTKQDITIGLGFDLEAGGRAVQNAVFEQMGFASDVVEATTKPSNPSKLRDYGEKRGRIYFSARDSESSVGLT